LPDTIATKKDFTVTPPAPSVESALKIDVPVNPSSREISDPAREADAPVNSNGPTVELPDAEKIVARAPTPSIPNERRLQLTAAARLPDLAVPTGEANAMLKLEPEAAPDRLPVAPDRAMSPAAPSAVIREIQAPEIHARNVPRPQASESPVAPVEHSGNRGSSLSDNESSPKDSRSPKPVMVAFQHSDEAPAPIRHHVADAVPESGGPKTPVPQGSTLTPPAASPMTPRAPDTTSRIAVEAPAEPSAPAPSAIRLSPKSEVTDISLSVPGSHPDSGADERVAIRMVQRGGEIHVAVRTPDQQAAQAMRQDLSRLAASLDDAGFHAETWRPANIAAPPSAHGQHEFSQQSRQGDTTGGDPQAEKRDRGGSQEQKRRQQHERPQWVAELEEHGS